MRREESGLGARSSPTMKVELGCSEQWKVPPCVLHHWIDELIDSFSCVQPLTHKHPSGNRLGGWWAGNGNTNLL